MVSRDSSRFLPLRPALPHPPPACVPACVRACVRASHSASKERTGARVIILPNRSQRTIARERSALLNRSVACPFSTFRRDYHESDVLNVSYNFDNVLTAIRLCRERFLKGARAIKAEQWSISSPSP
jgi:hypothetical protein